jgi:uncharacterized membrane protein AbrB (regulator of aidB expression)
MGRRLRGLALVIVAGMVAGATLASVVLAVIDYPRWLGVIGMYVLGAIFGMLLDRTRPRR